MTQPILYGLRKTTLLDFPGEVACTVFTCGCDFRCPFCHNAELVLPGSAPSGLLTTEDLMAFLRKRRGILDGVCVTGGEPLFHEEACLDLLSRIKKLGYSVKLDTNGSYPSRLRRVAELGLIDVVAMDIKNSPEKYLLTCGLRNCGEEIFQNVCESVDFLKSGTLSHEFRTTAAAGLHEVSDFDAIGQWLGAKQQYFIQSYQDNEPQLGAFSPMRVPTEEELKAFLSAVRRWIPAAEIRGGFAA